MTRTGTTLAALAILREPTPADRVLERQGNRKHKGDCVKEYGVCQLPHAMLDYVTARYVMDRLDSIGADNWQDLYVDRPDGSVRGGIGILIDGEWVWKWDVGTESDIESDKGSYSDAFKRAAVKWGIARDLYPDGKKQKRSASPSTPPAQTVRATAAAQTDGPWEGAVSKGRAPVDHNLREAADGATFGFVVSEQIAGSQYPRKTQVLVHGDLAHALATVWATGVPESAMVWGTVEMVPWQKDGQDMRPFRRVHATRVMTPEWTLPATDAAAPVSVAPGAADDLPDGLDNLPW